MEQVQSEGEFIKASSEINRMFNRVKEKLSPVTVRFPGVSRSLTSYVLDVSAQKRYLIIDEVLPKADNRIMQEGRPFNIETYYDGCRLRARDLTAQVISGSDGTTTYKVPFPTEVHYMQRRASYRAQVRRTLEINARTLDINRKVISGQLRDISAEGCQVQVFGNHVDNLRGHGDTPVPLKLYFPNGTTLVLKVEFRFIGYDEQGRFTKCGCRFAELDPHKEREISRVVTDLQRDFINFTKNGGKQEGVPPLFLPPEVDDDIDKLDKEDASEKREGSGKTEQEEKKSARKAAPPAKLDYRQLHGAAVAAVKSLIGSIRLEQSLPMDELVEAATGLYQGLLRDREQMLLMTHRRNPMEFIFEHPVGFAVLLADEASVQQPGLTADDLRDLMLAGLCHDVPRALLPEGDKENTYAISAHKLPVLRKNILMVRQLLRAEPRLPAIVSTIVSENYERMDGSGLPDGLSGDRLHPLGRLAATLDLIDTAAHLYRDDVYYYPAMAYKRALSMPAQFDPQLVKRVVMNQGLYPLGAAVKLSNGYLGLVMRQDDQRKPRIVRQVYNFKQNSQTPPKDIDLTQSAITIEGHGDPVRHSLSCTLLQSPLQL